MAPRPSPPLNLPMLNGYRRNGGLQELGGENDPVHYQVDRNIGVH